MPYRHLTLEDRRTIFRLLNAQVPVEEIADQLGRPILAVARAIPMVLTRMAQHRPLPESPTLCGAPLKAVRRGGNLIDEATSSRARLFPPLRMPRDGSATFGAGGHDD